MRIDETTPNERYYEELKVVSRHFEALRKAYVPLASEVLRDGLIFDDLYLLPTIDRSMRLIDGFLPLMESRNLTCVGALLRMQIDTCMRSYALFIAEDPEALVQGYLDGKKVSQFKDDQGKKMSDYCLKERLSEIFPETTPAYDNTSGYIHYSDRAFRSIARPVDDYDFGMGIGMALPEDVNMLLIEAAGAFTRFVTIHQKIIRDYSYGKSRHFDDGDEIEKER